MKRIALLLAVALFGCTDDVDAVLPDAAVIVADDAAAVPDAHVAPADAAVTCPTLTYGIVRCADLAPECSGPVQPPEVEGGLHCLPGYEDNLNIPCFCVGISTSDSWCLR